MEGPGRLQSMGSLESDTTERLHFHFSLSCIGEGNSWTRTRLEKEMATHSSILAWRIPGTGKPGGLPSMGLHTVGHTWSDLAAAAAAVPYYIVYLTMNQKNREYLFFNSKREIKMFLSSRLHRIHQEMVSDWSNWLICLSMCWEGMMDSQSPHSKMDMQR